jgi:hypothetical protein
MSIPELKDRAVFTGWAAGLLMAGLLLWSCTQSMQTRYLLRAVNRVMIAREDQRRLDAPLGRHSVSVNPMGVWYSMIDSDSDMFVFAIMWDGILIPCGAQVSRAGTVEELIPLGGHARQLLGRLPEGMVGMYVRRIEAAAAERSGQ